MSERKINMLNPTKPTCGKPISIFFILMWYEIKLKLKNSLIEQKIISKIKKTV